MQTPELQGVGIEMRVQQGFIQGMVMSSVLFSMPFLMILKILLFFSLPLHTELMVSVVFPTSLS